MNQTIDLTDIYNTYVDYYLIHGDLPGALAMMWRRKQYHERGTGK